MSNDRTAEIVKFEIQLDTWYAATKNGSKDEKAAAKIAYADLVAYVISIGLTVSRKPLIGKHSVFVAIR